MGFYFSFGVSIDRERLLILTTRRSASVEWRPGQRLTPLDIRLGTRRFGPFHLSTGPRGS